jgi:hypothetical protein
VVRPGDVEYTGREPDRAGDRASSNASKAEYPDGAHDLIPMMTPASILTYVTAEPFRPFRIHMASGKTYDIRHPEMVRVGRTNLLVFSCVSDQPEVYDEWQSVSLMLVGSISHLESPVSS